MGLPHDKFYINNKLGLDLGLGPIYAMAYGIEH